MIQMNYIKELNAFREWLLVHEFPGSAVSLWHTLMSINNAARWKSRFNAPTYEILSLVQNTDTSVNQPRIIHKDKHKENKERREEEVLDK